METVPIPEPPGLPFLGNITSIDSSFPLGSLVNLANLYGEIYKLNIAGRPLVVISTHSLLNELCDERRFSKKIAPVLQEIRHGVHDGLFTATGEAEPNWGIAHRVLMPAFGPMSISGMFDEMYDIASQLAMKWARYGPSHKIQVTDDFTRLTLDTLALCAMDYRFNSFYHDELHPFIEAMGDFLVEAGERSRRPFPSFFYRQKEAKYFADIELMRRTSDEVLQARKERPSDRKDLLNAMLNGKDPKTGQGLSDSSITDNLITFLIAGHETTSGLLSFAFYQLLKNPDSYRKAQQEVDEVIGTGPIKAEHLSKIPYLNAILRETLRLCSTIPAISVQANEDTIIGGKYAVKAGEPIVLLLAKTHLDPVVYGEDANEFKPERMLDENFDRLNKEFPNCYKPFGNGARSCIGRPFAIQEALLVLAMLLQNFNFAMWDSSYQLGIKQTLTIKPKDFFMKAELRREMTPTQLDRALLSSTNGAATQSSKASHPAQKTSKSLGPKGKPISIFFGSNTGTCESLAQRLASDAAAHGYHASVVASLDSAYQKVPKDQPVVIITASYEGQAPDNAAHFINWLESLKEREMDQVNYAVFGCGHHDWAQTFHRIPKLVDSKLSSLGGTPIAPLGLTDSAKGDMFSEFETWEDQVFWPAIASMNGESGEDTTELLQSSLSVQVSAPRCSTLRQDVKEAIVISTKQLSAPDVPVKKHIEIQLPSDVTYSAGDYLAVLPMNPQEQIQRVLRKYQLAWDAHLTIEAAGPTLLPVGTSVPAVDIFGAYVELGQPATKRNILSLINVTSDESTKKKLLKLANEQFSQEISEKRVSLLQLLEDNPSIELPLAEFLSMLPPMRVRQYSISSSPLWNSRQVTLTYALLDAPALSDPGSRRHIGVASSYLASLSTGDKLHVMVRKSHAAFHLPSDNEKTPLMLVASGTGIAPFRGFIQERAAQVGAGRELAPAVLWFGCRGPGMDDLYAPELAKWEAIGAVEVRRAYSRKPESSDGCKHVQDRLWSDREMVTKLWDDGAKVFVCGSREVGESVANAAMKIMMESVREKAEQKGSENKMTEEKAQKWFDSIRNVRYATDVFA